MYFKGRSKAGNLLFANAIFKWLNDENRMANLEKAKLTGESFYMDENEIDESVLRMFENS